MSLRTTVEGKLVRVVKSSSFPRRLPIPSFLASRLPSPTLRASLSASPSVSFLRASASCVFLSLGGYPLSLCLSFSPFLSTLWAYVGIPLDVSEQLAAFLPTERSRPARTRLAARRDDSGTIPSTCCLITGLNYDGRRCRRRCRRHWNRTGEHAYRRVLMPPSTWINRARRERESLSNSRYHQLHRYERHRYSGV